MRILRILDAQSNPLGWVEISKTIFAFNQNFARGEEFNTTEEAVEFVSRGFKDVQVKEETCTHQDNNS